MQIHVSIQHILNVNSRLKFSLRSAYFCSTILSCYDWSVSMLCVCLLFLSSHHSADGSKGNYRCFKARRPLCRSSEERNPIVKRRAVVHFHTTQTDHNKECWVAWVIASLITPDCAAAKTTQHDMAKRHLQATFLSSVHDKGQG